MRYLTLILLLFIVAACGNEPSNTSASSTPPTTQGGGQVDEQYEQGEKLFKTYCRSCHTLNKDLIAPALAGIGQRRDKQWIYSFVRNSKAFIQSGDEEAVKVYEEWNKTPMTLFPELTDEQIDAIIHYCDTPE